MLSYARVRVQKDSVGCLAWIVCLALCIVTFGLALILLLFFANSNEKVYVFSKDANRLISLGNTNEWIYIPMDENAVESACIISWGGGNDNYYLQVSPGRSYTFQKAFNKWIVTQET